MRSIALSALWLIALCFSGLFPPTLKASEAKPPHLFIELNALAQQSSACRVSFVMQNNLPTPIEELVLEVVLFDQAKRVTSLLVIKSRALPVKKTRVRQYDLKNIPCQTISRFLVNDVKVCKGKSLTPQSCLKALTLNSRTTAKLGS